MRVTKSEAVRAVKNANNRLKPVRDTCYRIAQQRDIRLPQKEQKLMLSRLSRELSPEDTAGPLLQEAVETFWRELYAGADPARQLVGCKNPSKPFSRSSPAQKTSIQARR